MFLLVSVESLLDSTAIISDLYTNDLICHITLSRRRLSLLVAGTNILVVRLNIEPNPMAITVHTKQMTLYGMLKSGVGKETWSKSV